LNYLRIVDEVGRDGNEGMICLCHGRIWFKAGQQNQEDGRKKNVRYLIGEIKDAGVEVLNDKHFRRLAEGKQPCVGGSGYLGSLAFPEVEGVEKGSGEIVEPAIQFLQKTYRVFRELD
jgi:hypothetical protein